MIVALDSKDDSANYVHILDVQEDKKYYCPCCKGLVKPRAYKKDINYQVQPHFYHETGGCSEESFIHFICKAWLFEKGCKFRVNGIEYIVTSIETEKTLHTQFGDYRPDIIVYTENNKTFYFEIKYSNKKTEVYIPKWDELGNDVVEVDTREFINNKRDEIIPEFKLIYSDGKCFIKSYSHKDYEDVIAQRKIEWKRQDKINYKMQWEKLDWFWSCLYDYKNKKNKIDNVIESFSSMEFQDMDICMKLIKKMKCLDIYDKCIPIINNCFLEKTKDLFDKYNIKMEQYSPRIFVIYWKIYSLGCINYYETFKYRKSIQYYDNNLYEAINNELLNYEADIDHLPQIENIKKLYKHNNLKTDIVCNIILFNNGIAEVFNDKNECLYRYDYSDSRYTTIDDYYAFNYLKPHIIKYNFANVSNKEKRRKIIATEKNLIMYSKLKWIINKINTSNNKFWECSYEGCCYNDMYSIHIGVKNEISLQNTIYISFLDTKYEILKEIKLIMSKIIKEGSCNCKILRKEAKIND